MLEQTQSSIVCGCGDDGCASITITPQQADFSLHLLLTLVISNTRFRYVVASIIITIVGLFIGYVIDPDWLFIVWWVAAITGLLIPIKSTVKSLKKFTLTINTLLSVATISALLLGLYEEAIILVVVFSFGEILEGVLVKLTEKDLDALRNLLPQKAVLSSTLVEVDLSLIYQGSQLLIRTGDIVPVDGKVDQMIEIQASHLTGESRITTVKKGELVYAGSRVVSGSTILTATVSGTESSVHHLIQSVEEALKKKSKSEKFSQQFGKIYIPSTFILALGLALIVPVFDNFLFEKWFLRALVVLVVSCACGLAVSVPVTMVSAISAAAGEGIVIRGGAAIEKSKNVKTIVFDKTGTLTLGRPVIKSIHWLDERSVDTELMNTLISLLSTRSKHPVTKALHEHFNSYNGSANIALMEITEEAGFGVSGKFNHPIYETNHTLTLSRDIEQLYDEEVSLNFGLNCSHSVIQMDDEIIGLVIFEDQIRKDAKIYLEELKNQDYNLVMLSGDNAATAEYVGHQLGIPTVYSQILPDGKAAILQELKKDGPVAMVGDGINDAPALAHADLSIAMGLTGSQIASDIADVILIDDQLDLIGKLLDHCRRSNAIARQNVVLALFTVSLLLIFAAIGWLNLVSGIIANEFTALLIIANGLRPLRYDFKDKSRKTKGTPTF